MGTEDGGRSIWLVEGRAAADHPAVHRQLLWQRVTIPSGATAQQLCFGVMEMGFEPSSASYFATAFLRVCFLIWKNKTTATINKQTKPIKQKPTFRVVVRDQLESTEQRVLSIWWTQQTKVRAQPTELSHRTWRQQRMLERQCHWNEKEGSLASYQLVQGKEQKGWPETGPRESSSIKDVAGGEGKRWWDWKWKAVECWIGKRDFSRDLAMTLRYAGGITRPWWASNKWS